MPGHRAPVRGALLLAALAITLGAAMPVLAADRDPRCEDWEAASAPPPGIDLSIACPVRELRTEAVDLDSEPLLPYVVGLVVMAGVLGVFGVIAMRVTRPRPDRRSGRAEDWWACPSCGAANSRDRAACFACQAPRGAPVTGAASAAPTEDPHPA
jgi:hypothetical protein